MIGTPPDPAGALGVLGGLGALGALTAGGGLKSAPVTVETGRPSLRSADSMAPACSASPLTKARVPAVGAVP